MRVNHSRRYLPKEQKEGFALFLSKNKGFPRKTKEQILNPVMKFLTSVFRVFMSSDPLIQMLQYLHI